MCPPLWDNASCIPPTAGGDTAVLPCMRMYAGQYYDAGSKYKEYVMLGCQSFQLDYAVCEKEKMKFAYELHILIVVPG